MSVRVSIIICHRHVHVLESLFIILGDEHLEHMCTVFIGAPDRSKVSVCVFAPLCNHSVSPEGRSNPAVAKRALLKFLLS